MLSNGRGTPLGEDRTAAAADASALPSNGRGVPLGEDRTAAADASAVGSNGRGTPLAEVRPRAGRIASRPAPIGAAVVGCGYWGPNLARNLAEAPEFRLHALCDRDPERLRALGRSHPHARALHDFDDVLCDDAVEAVIIATPPHTHHPLAKRALLAGKHVLVEKPLATRLVDGGELADLARASELMLMPGHTFIYSPAVNTVRELIRADVVGDIHFITSSRMNLGKYQREGVVCDLAPHDLSILLYWLDQPVVEIAASGSCVFREGVPETAFVTLTFACGTTANVQLSWLAPRKVRQMIVVGSRRMVLYDDTASDEPVRVYDRGMDHGPPSNFGEHQLVYRTGDVVIPRVEPQEPLRLELQDFANSIRTGEEPRSNVALGLAIVAALETAGASMRDNGAPLGSAFVVAPAAAADEAAVYDESESAADRESESAAPWGSEGPAPRRRRSAGAVLKAPAC